MYHRDVTKNFREEVKSQKRLTYKYTKTVLLKKLNTIKDQYKTLTYMKKHYCQEGSFQRCSCNPVEHLLWKIFAKIVNGFELFALKSQS